MLIENDEIITKERILAEKINHYYPIIVDRSCGVRPTKLDLLSTSLNDNESVTDAINVLNIFSKVYEIVLKNKLVSALNDYMPPFISAYREGCSIQHVPVKIVEKI